MSAFSVPVVRIDAIEPIPNADNIEVARIGGYCSVVRKGQFRPGELAVYLPEGAVVPRGVLRAIGLWEDGAAKGRLAGAEGNRIKAIMLRGVLSQGLLYPVDQAGEPFITLPTDDGIGALFPVREGDDVADALGVAKWEPPVPAEMAGTVMPLDGIPGYDIENRKRFPDVLLLGEPVIVTEKIHGTYCLLSVIPGLDHPGLLDGDLVASSKGFGARGLVFMTAEGLNQGNIYVQMLRNFKAQLLKLREYSRRFHDGEPIHVAGELYGVQDLTYGLPSGVRRFRAFDVYVGHKGRGRWLGCSAKAYLLAQMGIAMVDVLYEGPYHDGLLDLAQGDSITGNETHLREGIVITPLLERRDPRLGRVILKEINPHYLLRKGKVTEYQ
jgi:RNA ligase (TIGR02306 family)